MIDLKKKVLPSTVDVGGILFKVKTDFRYWLSFLDIINDQNAPVESVDFMYEDKKPNDRVAGVRALINFAFPPRPLPRPMSGGDENLKTMDYKIDADLIFAAFWEQYQIDLLETDLHYYKFRALIEGLKDTKFNEIMSFRSWKKDSKSYEQTMRELRQAWEITDELTLTDEERAQLEAFDAKLNGSTITTKED